MSNYEVTEEIQITGGLLSVNVFEEKLMRNFYIINSRLKRLDEIADLGTKLKSLEKEHKFIASKVEVLEEKLPQNHSTPDFRYIIKEQMIELLNSKDERVNNSKYFEDLNKQISLIKEELAKVKAKDESNNVVQNVNQNWLLSKENTNLTIGQGVLGENKRNKTKNSLTNVLDKNEIDMIEEVVKTEESSYPTILEQINNKFEELERKMEQMKLSKLFNENGEKDIERFDRYEHYEQKSANTTRKIKEKPIRLDGIKKENVKGEILKNDLYSDFQKAESLRADLVKTDRMEGRKSIKGIQTFTSSFNNDIKISEYKGNEEVDKEKDKNERLRPNKSIKKLEKLERSEKVEKKIKIEDFKELNAVLKDMEIRIENRISHELFIGFVEDIEEKMEIIKITKDPSNEISELRKMIYSIESRLQSIITFLQNSVSEDDALLVKKQWTCISCDKGVDKFSGKTGQHLNWDNLQSRKISPTKAGAFGQTGQMASKLRSLMENQKNEE